jgi:hypothetical protein
MSERLDKGSVSPTKGSRFIFLGNYPEYSGDKSKWSFKPKYREEEKALLVKKKPNMNAKNPVTGVLNDYISKIAFDYYTKIIADYVSNGMYKSVNSPQYDAPAKEKKFKTRGKNKGQEKNVDTEDLRYMRQFASIAKSRNQHRIEQLINSVVRLSAKMKKLKHLDKVTATRETKQIFNDSKKVIYDYALGDGNDLKKSIADEIAAIKAQMSAKKYILDMKELKRIKRRPVIRRKKRGK